MKTDISVIYEHICNIYPVNLSSSKNLKPQCRVDYPVLHGCSSLGSFELFYDGVSFPFYIKRGDGSLCAHWHLQTLQEAQNTIMDFMEGRIELAQFEQLNDI